ncbi:MAG: hypothetical protein GY856_09815, partial [bacterium]|nr:hypothetical protein [bacterium]
PQCRLAYVVSACVAQGYVASTELLTRTDKGSDFATDVCVRKEGIDPSTGGRYLEELSFEVANTQTLKNLEAVRVPKLMARGVRRLFAILVQEGDVLEWSTRGGGKWKGLGPEDVIRDRTLHSPLRVGAILDAAEAKRQVSEALLAEGEPYLMGVVQEREAKGRAKGRAEGEAKGRAKGRAEGEARGLAEAILRAFKHHGIEIEAPNRRALLACRDRALLERWLDKALAAESASNILAELEETS